ncbi:MAG: hypothetical protein ACR2N7_11270 [Acidimicrobiia bacterium]
MSKRWNIAVLAGALLAFVSTAAFAAPPERYSQDVAMGTFIGAEEGLDRAFVSVIRGDDDRIYFELCDYKTDIWPEPAGLEPECWGTPGGTSLAVDTDRFVFNRNEVRFAGPVVLTCLFAWECGDEPDVEVYVEVAFDVDSVERTVRVFEPAEGLYVRETNLDYSIGSGALSVSGSPIPLEAFDNGQDFDGWSTKQQIRDKTGA